MHPFTGLRASQEKSSSNSGGTEGAESQTYSFTKGRERKAKFLRLSKPVFSSIQQGPLHQKANAERQVCPASVLGSQNQGTRTTELSGRNSRVVSLSEILPSKNPFLSHWHPGSQGEPCGYK